MTSPATTGGRPISALANDDDDAPAGKPRERQHGAQGQADEGGDEEGRERDAQRQADDLDQHRIAAPDHRQRQAKGTMSLMSPPPGEAKIMDGTHESVNGQRTEGSAWSCRNAAIS